MPRVKSVANKGKGQRRQFNEVAKFYCPVAEAKYNNQVVHRELYMERGLVANSEGLKQLHEWLQATIKERGWQKFVTKPEQALIEVVRELYLNFLSHEWPTVVTVREVPVQFTAEALNNLFGLEIGKCVFSPCKGEFGGDELV